MATASIETDPRRRRRNIIAWILSVFLALEFLFAGGMKLIGNPQMVDQFNLVGLGQWFRYFTGTLEILGAIGILIPRFSRLAALLLAVIMVGAIIAVLARIHISVWPPILTLLVTLVVARIRRGQAQSS